MFLPANVAHVLVAHYNVFNLNLLMSSSIYFHLLSLKIIIFVFIICRSKKPCGLCFIVILSIPTLNKVFIFIRGKLIDKSLYFEPDRSAGNK